MVLPTENSPLSRCSKKTQLFKPHLTSSSIDGSPASQNPSAPSTPDLKTLSFSVFFNGWRYTNTKFKSWARKMAALHEPIWRKAGIFEAVVASTFRICKNTDLVLGITEKWCPETKTFVFPWGETTITLEDVMMLLGFSVLGSPVFAILDCSGEKVTAKLKKEWQNLKTLKTVYVSQVMWMKRFMDSGDELEHVAFLVLWLSYFVFPLHTYHCNEAILPIAVHLSSGTKIALAPAVLAHLYAELNLLKNHIRAFSESPLRIDLAALFKMVQVWTWERFREIQPKPNPLLEGEPRIARWSNLKQRTSNLRQILDNSKIDSFEWRPYTKTVKNWKLPKFYPEKAMWVSVDSNLDDDFITFARCTKVSKLVGIDSMQHYFPNRVASQFGMLQDVSCPVNRINLSKEAAWNDYNKPIDDLTLYIPSVSALSYVTPMFCEWWTNRDNESAETLKSKTIRGDDNSFVLSGCKMNRPSKVGLKIAEDSTNKRCKYMKQAHENSESTRGHYQKQVPSDSDDEDDSLSIAQIVSLYKKKKYSDVKNSGGDPSELLGKKSRLEAGNNDSERYQKLELIRDVGDETVLPPEVGQMNEKADETGSKAYESMDRSPSNESNVHIAVGDGSRGQDVLLHDDGLGSEETMKSNEESEELDKRNDDFDEDDVDIDTTEKRFQELKLLASSIEERINKAERDVKWLIERRAIKQIKMAEARLM